MPNYKYTATDISGKKVKGFLEALNTQSFYERLNEKELFCTNFTEISVSETSRKPKHKLSTGDLVLFCRKLSTMMAAGMSITNTLDIMCTSAEKPHLTKLYLQLYETVRGGIALSQAMRETGGAFPVLLVNMVESGEESGNVDMMVDKLATYYEKQAKVSGKIKTATTYPKLLGGVALCVVVILFTMILPQIFVVFENQELPMMTRILMAFSNFLIKYWYICIIGVVVLIVGFKILLKSKRVSIIKDRLSLNMPIVGKLMRKIYSARFASTLAILYSSGLSLLNGIRLSINVIENTYIAESLNKVVEDISVGETLSSAIIESNVFDQLLPNMIKIGEETGSLDTILISVADFYETETETAIESLLGILEPLLLIVMALVIGSIVVAVITPIFASYGKV